MFLELNPIFLSKEGQATKSSKGPIWSVMWLPVDDGEMSKFRHGV